MYYPSPRLSVISERCERYHFESFPAAAQSAFNQRLILTLSVCDRIVSAPIIRTHNR